MLALPYVQQIAADNASKAQKRQARYYNASRREVRYNLDDKVWKRNRVLSSALQGVAAKLAPKFAGPYTIAAQLGPNVYEVVDQEGKSAGKVHVENLKPFHVRTASEEDSKEEQAEASPPEVSEEHDASTKRHSANARIPETEAHPRKRGRPRQARLVVKQAAQILGRQASKQKLVANGADKRPSQPSTSGAVTPLPRSRGRPAGSRNTAATTRVTAHSPQQNQPNTRR